MPSSDDTLPAMNDATSAERQPFHAVLCSLIIAQITAAKRTWSAESSLTVLLSLVSAAWSRQLRA